MRQFIALGLLFAITPLTAAAFPCALDAETRLKKVVADDTTVVALVAERDGQHRPLNLIAATGEGVARSQVASSSGVRDEMGRLVETPRGPMSWGTVESSLYLVRHFGSPNPSLTQVSAQRMPFATWLNAFGYEVPLEEKLEAKGRLLDAARIWLLQDFVLELTEEFVVELNEEWDLYYDMNYVEKTRFDLFRVRRGEMRWWSCNESVDADAVDQGRVETLIDSPFRALRTGDRLVLADENGRVFSSPREGHALIGQIANWPTDEESDRDVYLLEDATTHELRIVEVVEEKGDGNGGGGKRFVRSLEFDEDKDNTHGNLFTADLPREEIQQALIRLTKAIEDGQNSDGGKGNNHTRARQSGNAIVSFSALRVWPGFFMSEE